MPVQAEFAECLQGLFKPKRTKVLYGGRGAGRSWGIARWLLLLGTERAIRVLCCRELQNSITESVHKLLSDQIEALGLSAFYDIQVAKITGKNGTSFSFEGIKNNTTKIKSYEAIDYCWVEEADKVSKASWSILIPTIRKPGSEIVMSFNPSLETDYTFTRFVKDPDLRAVNDNVKESSQSIVIRMTYKDNPWFPEPLRLEMEGDKKRDYDGYLNVWEGHCLVNLEGAVFAKELRRAREQNRITLVPWDRETPVNTYWDLGRRDQTSIWFAQRVALQYRILGYFEDSGEDIHHYLRYCQSLPYVYGTFFLPHDAAAKRIGEKRSIEKIVRDMGKHVVIVPRTQKKVNAINAARMIFPNCYFDEEGCVDGLQRLTHYRYRVVDGQFSEEPLHDNNSNGADAFMTLGQSIKCEDSGSRSGLVSKLKAKAREWGADSPQGWMG